MRVFFLFFWPFGVSLQICDIILFYFLFFCQGGNVEEGWDKIAIFL